MNISDFEEEIKLLNNNKFNFMNDEISQSSKIETIENNETKEKNKKKDFKFIKLIMFTCFTLLGFINHIGYYLIITSSQQFATNLGNASLIAF